MIAHSWNESDIFATSGDEAVVLTPDTIYVKVKLQKAKQSISGPTEEVGFKDRLLSDETISISTITRIAANKKTGWIRLFTKINGKKDSEFIVIEDAQVKQQFIDKLYTYMQGSHTYRIEEYSAFKAGIKPSLTLLITILVGMLLTWLAMDIENGPERTMYVKSSVKLLYTLVSFIGPVGVMIIAGIVALITIYVLVRRISNPPIMVLIEPDK
ncbi:hypothetical protein J2Z22_001922 [Paenibacillus forsythiae]|uniref:Bacterial Pleckstrin homology domain-containing protein n=1 Tax=Paenibacillus forsythiae TaxID=365616 RepID=A0ABU3H6P9_9BACL|nr:hypothetical protein [Paenibacillus forsythiae]MDT3426396.1 hypothetical protein [Paenibacillus forsythiae]